MVILGRPPSITLAESRPALDSHDREARPPQGEAKPIDRSAATIGGTLLATLAAIRLAVLVTGHVPMGHDTFQYLQLQYLVFSNAAFTGEMPLWWPLMTHGTISSVWVAISQGLLSSILIPVAPMLRSVNYLPLYQLGVLVDEGVLLLGTLLLGRRCFQSTSALVFVCSAAAGSSLAVTQVWWNFHIFYLIPLILYCTDRAIGAGSARYLFLAALFAAGTLLGNLPYFLPVTAFTLCVFGGLAAVLHPSGTAVALVRLRGRLNWRHAGALALPAVFAVGIGAFQLYGWTDQVLNANTGRSLSGEVTSLDEFISYGGYLSIWKWLDLVARYNNNLDNTLYAGLLVIPFALTAALRVRSRLAAVFGGTAVVLALFGAATVVTVVYFYAFPLGKLFRHIGLTAPLAVLFLVFYAGFGVQWLDETLRRRSSGTKWWKRADPGVWVPPVTVAAIAVLLALQKADVIQVLDYSPWSSVATRNQVVLSASAIDSRLALVLAICALFGFLLVTVIAVPARWLRVALGGLLLAHAADVFTWKTELEFRQAPAVPTEVQELFNPTATPYIAYRSQAYFSAPRFVTLVPWLVDRPEQLVPTLPASTIGAYGAQYWNNESFVYVDALASVFRSDHWLRSVDSFYNAWDPGPRLSDRHLGFPIPARAAYYRMAGSSAPKLQVFSQLHVLPDREAIAAQFRLPSFSGNAVFATSDAVAGASMPSNLLTTAPARDGADEHIAEATVDVTDFSANTLRVHVETPSGEPALLYYADGWHPFWHATVNGSDSPVVQANLGYKAVALPGGAADVVFAFGTVWSTVLVRMVQAAGAILLVGALALIRDVCLKVERP